VAEHTMAGVLTDAMVVVPADAMVGVPTNHLKLS
jgi:hypothetical protein